MDPYVFWAITCLGLAVVIFFVEIFIPSGGILGFIATTALVIGIVLLFKVNTTLGLLGALGALIGVPILAVVALKLWPHTPLFRWLLLRAPASGAGAGAEAEGLMGAEGTALTALRPVGTCLINGKRYDCLAEGGVIEAGAKVRVVAAEGMAVKVRREEAV